MPFSPAQAQTGEPQHVEAVNRDAGDWMPAWPSASVRKWSRCVACPREEGVESEREPMMEDARSIREGLWRMAQDAAEPQLGVERGTGRLPATVCPLGKVAPC